MKSFQELERPGQKWHLNGYLGMAGNYLLMMFYTTVTGWMLYYFYQMLTGKFAGQDAGEVAGMFQEMLASPKILGTAMVIVVAAGIFVCSMGLQKGVEKITKTMMSLLLAIIIILAIHSCTLENGLEGLKFYLLPDFGRMQEVGVWETITAAMNQAFFTLSLGIGAMGIFGSYIGKDHSLLGESINIAILDTFVAFVSGLIIFPACFSFGVEPGSGPNLLFITLPNIFNIMAGGRFWGSLFFLFMCFAAITTLIAVIENIMTFFMDLTGCSRKKAAVGNFIGILVLSLPCAFGFNLWQGIQPLGPGSTILDFEDFILSNNLLPLGSLVFLFFCTRRYGWGWDKFYEETAAGSGMPYPKFARNYVTYVLPVIVLIVFIGGYLS